MYCTSSLSFCVYVSKLFDVWGIEYMSVFIVAALIGRWSRYEGKERDGAVTTQLSFLKCRK